MNVCRVEGEREEGEGEEGGDREGSSISLLDERQTELIAVEHLRERSSLAMLPLL